MTGPPAASLASVFPNGKLRSAPTEQANRTAMRTEHEQTAYTLRTGAERPENSVALCRDTLHFKYRNETVRFLSRGRPPAQPFVAEIRFADHVTLMISIRGGGLDSPAWRGTEPSRVFSVNPRDGFSRTPSPSRHRLQPVLHAEQVRTVRRRISQAASRSASDTVRGGIRPITSPFRPHSQLIRPC